MLIQPILLQSLPRHLFRAVDPPVARGCTARTIKRLIHLPFRGGIKERQDTPFLQGTVIDHANLHLVHVEHDGGRAGVVAEHQIGVELDVLGARDLHGGIALRGDQAGAGDGCEQGAGGEVHERECTGPEGFGTALDLDQPWVCGRRVVFGFYGRGVRLEEVWFGDGRHDDAYDGYWLSKGPTSICERFARRDLYWKKFCGNVLWTMRQSWLSNRSCLA